VQHLDDVLDTLEEPPLLLVLDGVQDPHNLGACLRSADAFGVHAVIAPKDRAVGITATVEKVACGDCCELNHASYSSRLVTRTTMGIKPWSIPQSSAH
jgi:23S rRNA (guanosine2251-2'-O)-methyltransferase